MEVVETLKATRAATTAAYRRLGLFGDSATQTTGEETLNLVIGFPEFDLAAWSTNPAQIQADQAWISAHADEVEVQIKAFVKSSGSDLGFKAS
jgi:hypothetical protein